MGAIENAFGNVLQLADPARQGARDKEGDHQRQKGRRKRDREYLFANLRPNKRAIDGE